MAKLPTIKKLIFEEIDQTVKWLPKLLAPTNSFFESVYSALNKGLTVTDNMDGEIREVTLDGTYPYKLKWSRKSAPKAAWIAYSDTTPSAGVFLHWEYTADGMFSIISVEGLTPTAAAKVTVRIIILCN